MISEPTDALPHYIGRELEIGSMETREHRGRRNRGKNVGDITGGRQIKEIERTCFETLSTLRVATRRKKIVKFKAISYG